VKYLCGVRGHGQRGKQEMQMETQCANGRTYVSGRLCLPDGYAPVLSLRQTEQAIKFIKDTFQSGLAAALNLSRISAPLCVPAASGLNDHLNGVERPVRFDIKSIGVDAEIVQSLAKWKRAALADYGFVHGEGIYTDMNAIRRDEILDNLHSVYVDQWDWERVINADERTVPFLRDIVQDIYGVLLRTQCLVRERYPEMPDLPLPLTPAFVHSEDLEADDPDHTPQERVDRVCQQAGAVFVIGIGAPLRNGLPQDGRAADYDDWSTPTDVNHRGLNGDLFIWNPVLGCSYELSSMGIRVDPDALLSQLEVRGELTRKDLPYHRRLLRGELPLTIGGGIGQSRLCMLLLHKAHIGEVQSGIWPDTMRSACAAGGISLL
jgi:aspartate--ammonia ligase